MSLAAGILPVLAGLGLRLWAVGHLVKTEELAVAGPYAYLRHPLYMGTLLVVTGWAIMASSPVCWILYAIILAGYFGYYMPYKNRIEAARLEEHHGEPYIRYAVAVPPLIPRLHPYRPLSLDRVRTGAWTREVFLENHEVGTSVVALLGTAAIAVRWTLG